MGTWPQGPLPTESEGQVRVTNQARSGIRIDAKLRGENSNVDCRAKQGRVAEE